MELTLFVLFSFAATVAALASPVSFARPRPQDKYCDERGEIILLNDLHRTCFHKK